MVSSKIVKREYPPRMYPAGKSPLQNKSMNHCCSLPDIGKRQRKDKKLSAITSFLGEDIYNDIRDNSQLGVLLKLASRLKCDAFDPEDKWNVDHTGFWGELKMNPEEGPTWEELVRIMPHSGLMRRRSGLVCCLSCL
ncbi:unnamed protein product [Microthlaspi erraticum]|uniref:Uncharacterized protein n=1 Tax=Microthlaspi erraticum TaxID=1685480 RepID=A0A6D2KYV9_9BRAS|nr:unnamed protein product [Microthlaspi erraticum]